MHPSIVRDGLEPDGSVPKCPICGMPLSLHHKGEAAHLPDGVLSRVELNAHAEADGGRGDSRGRLPPAGQEIRTVGFVDYDESRRSRIVTRVAGFIERLYVDKSFTQVQKGDPLAAVYSRTSIARCRSSCCPDRGATDLVESGKQRLKLMGIAENEIDEIVGVQELILAVNRGAQSQIEQAKQRLETSGMSGRRSTGSSRRGRPTRT